EKAPRAPPLPNALSHDRLGVGAYENVSISPVGVPPNSDQPEASQCVADTHETPRSEAPPAPGASGVAWLAELDPFHSSANGIVLGLPSPTAWHDVVETHEMP